MYYYNYLFMATNRDKLNIMLSALSSRLYIELRLYVTRVPTSITFNNSTRVAKSAFQIHIEH